MSVNFGLNISTHFWDDFEDPRAKQWLLTSTLWPIIGIIVTYLTVILYILPTITKSKKQPHLKSILATYYMIHSLISIWFVYICIAYLMKMNLKISYNNLRCLPIVKTFDGYHYEIAVWTYAWLWFKISEMIETVLIIIVYGKTTAFNLIHHTIHPFMIVICLHFYLGGTSAVFGFINNIEHSLLYFVISMRIFSNKFKKSSQIWFKKFHLFVSIGSLIISTVFFVPLPHHHCAYELHKTFIFLGLIVFLCLSISCRWNYISHEDAFGQTRFILFLNRRLGRKRF